LYYPSAGVFTITGPLSGGRIYHTATRLANGKVLVAGGQTYYYDHAASEIVYSHLSSCEIYDPNKGTFSTASPLMTARRTIPPRCYRMTKSSSSEEAALFRRLRNSTIRQKALLFPRRSSRRIENHTQRRFLRTAKSSSQGIRDDRQLGPTGERGNLRSNVGDVRSSGAVPSWTARCGHSGWRG